MDPLECVEFRGEEDVSCGNINPPGLGLFGSLPCVWPRTRGPRGPSALPDPVRAGRAGDSSKLFLAGLSILEWMRARSRLRATRSGHVLSYHVLVS